MKLSISRKTCGSLFWVCLVVFSVFWGASAWTSLVDMATRSIHLWNIADPIALGAIQHTLNFVAYGFEGLAVFFLVLWVLMAVLDLLDNLLHKLFVKLGWAKRGGKFEFKTKSGGFSIRSSHDHERTSDPSILEFHRPSSQPEEC